MVAYRTYKAEVLAPQVRMLSDEIAFNVALSLLIASSDSIVGLWLWMALVCYSCNSFPFLNHVISH